MHSHPEARAGAAALLRRLIDVPLATVTGQINTVLAVRPPHVIVATKRSPEGQRVPIDWVELALGHLIRDGSVEIHPRTIKYRSSFIGAVLLTLPGARVAGSPPTIVLDEPGVQGDSAGHTFAGDLSRLATAEERREQGLLRRHLFGDAAEAPCALCGETYPVRFLWTAHIKKRAACTDDEARDLDNIAMAACLFGCDALYESGHVAVDESGRVVVAEDGRHGSGFDRHLARLRGRRVVRHSPRTADYFTWHRANTYRG